MNELIERLAREAGMQIDHAMRVDLRNGTQSAVGTALLMREPVDHLARFAALVAEQCATLCNPYAMYPGGRPNEDDIQACEFCVSEIRAKFPMPKP